MDQNNLNKASKMVSEYYSDKIRKHGISPEGVDWNGRDSQYLRFEQLSKLLGDEAATCADIGCGYGAYFDYLQDTGKEKINYHGYDLSDEMVQTAKSSHPEFEAQFHTIDTILHIAKADYAIASGIYNVRQGLGDNEWNAYIKSSLREMNSVAAKGFAFNILTAYSDIEKRRDYLYYASPEEFFGFCKTNFSRDVALLHDYGLYEFTIIVRK